MIECENQAKRLNEPPEPSPGLSVAMPWVTAGQNMRPEGAREPLEKSKRVKSYLGCTSNGRFSRPFRADDLFVFQSQGIARMRDALGCILLTLRANH
jgi:hypothetical protein